MMERALDDRFYGVLSSILNVARDQLGPESSQQSVREWDSVKHIYVMFALEEEFDIQFTDDELVNLSSAAGLVEAVAAKTTSGRAESKSA
jgi:acyl carrier protein